MYFRLILLFTLFCFINLVGMAAQSDSTLDMRVKQLTFQPYADQEGLFVAMDQKGWTWIKGNIPANLLGSSLIFQIPSPRLNNYQLFIEEDGTLKEIKRKPINDQQLFKNRFPIYLLNPKQETFYIGSSNSLTRINQIKIQKSEQFMQSQSAHLFSIGIYYGIAIMSLIFNIVFYLIFKDRSFIAYFFVLLTTFITFFYEDGMFYYFSNGNWTMHYLNVWNSSITAMFAVLFTYYFLGLGLDDNWHKLKNWFYGICLSLLIGSLIYTLTDWTIVSNTVLVCCFILVLPCFYLAIIRFREDVYARFLSIIFGLLVVSGILYTLHSRTDHAAFAWFDINMFRAFSSLEMISISFAIIFKVRAIQFENDYYRSELKEYLLNLEKNINDPEPLAITSKESKTSVLNLDKTSSLYTKEEVVESLKSKYYLTDRETEVLFCIWKGMTNQEIAEALFVSLSTTKYHTSNLYTKLDVKNRHQAQVLGQNIWSQQGLVNG